MIKNNRESIKTKQNKIANSLIQSNENSFENYLSENEFYSKFMHNTSELLDLSNKEDFINLSLFDNPRKTENEV